MSTTRLTYTTGFRTEQLDLEFEAALESIRAAEPQPLPHRIAGDQVQSGEVIDRVDPSRSERIAARVHEADAAAVSRAVTIAREAQRAWAKTEPQIRAAALRAAIPSLEHRKIELAATISLETGKPRAESIAEVEESCDLFSTYASWLDGAELTHALGSQSRNEQNRSVLKPYGVFGIASPFNFPLALSVNMTAAALAGGNAAVLKPSTLSPRSSAVLADVFAEAGLPEGLFSVVHGRGRQTGGAMAESEVDGFAFTGSAEVGYKIARAMQAGRYPRPIVAEMGGKNPTLVTADADLEKAVEGVSRAAFGLSGQKCSACSRAIVFDSVHDEFVDRFAALATELPVGDPADRDAFTGPVIDAAAVARFQKAVATARDEGMVIAGGDVLDLPGFFVAPTIVTELPRGHRLDREELFLPFLTVTRVASIEEAIEEANAVEYGLTAGIFSEDDDEVTQFLERIEAGVVYVNRRAGATTGAWPGMQSFCGWKASGFSGKGAFGRYYVPLFMREQSQTVAT